MEEILPPELRKGTVNLCRISDHIESERTLPACGRGKARQDDDGFAGLGGSETISRSDLEAIWRLERVRKLAEARVPPFQFVRLRLQRLDFPIHLPSAVAFTHGRDADDEDQHGAANEHKRPARVRHERAREFHEVLSRGFNFSSSPSPNSFLIAMSRSSCFSVRSSFESSASSSDSMRLATRFRMSSRCGVVAVVLVNAGGVAS